MMMKTRSAGPRGTWPLLRSGLFCSPSNSDYYARRRSRGGPRTARASKAGPRRPLKYRPRRRPRSGTRGGRTRAASCGSASSCRSATRRRRRGPWTTCPGIRRRTRGASGPAVLLKCAGPGRRPTRRRQWRRRRGESGGRGAVSCDSRRRPGSAPPRRRSRGGTTGWWVASSPRRRWKAGMAFRPGPLVSIAADACFRRS